MTCPVASYYVMSCYVMLCHVHVMLQVRLRRPGDVRPRVRGGAAAGVEARRAKANTDQDVSTRGQAAPRNRYQGHLQYTAGPLGSIVFSPSKPINFTACPNIINTVPHLSICYRHTFNNIRDIWPRTRTLTKDIEQRRYFFSQKHFSPNHGDHYKGFLIDKREAKSQLTESDS